MGKVVAWTTKVRRAWWAGMAIVGCVLVSVWPPAVGEARPARSLSLASLFYDYGSPGPYQAGRTEVTVARDDATTFSAKLYYPAAGTGDGAPYDSAGAPYPAISFGHGYLTDPERYRSTLEHLATWGYFVMATESGLDLFPSHARYAEDLSQTLTYLEQQNANSGSWLYQQVDTTQLGLSGHSMGGGASILATAEDGRVRVLANLAAAETNPSAEDAMPQITVPVRLIAGDEDGTVPYTTTEAMVVNGNAPRQFALIDGGWHCGFLDSSILGCDSGSLERATQLQITRRLLTEFFELYLRATTPGPGGADTWRSIWGPERGDDPLVAISAEAGIVVTPAQQSGQALLGLPISYTLTLSNTRPLVDSYTLLVDENAWTSSPSPPQTGSVNPGSQTLVTVDVTVPPAADPPEDSVLLSARSVLDGGTRGYGWITTHAQAFAASIQLTGQALELAWTGSDAACIYEVHRATSPYFDPGPGSLQAQVIDPPYIFLDDEPGVVGDPAVNHFYLIGVTCGGQSLSSGYLGEFDFSLEPGSP